MVLFENDQWAVTDWGLVSKKPAAPMEYEISAARLLETANRGSQRHYDWPEQLAEKTWVNTAMFLEAYQQAIVLHAGKYKGSVDPTMMRDSITAAWNADRMRRR